MDSRTILRTAAITAGLLAVPLAARAIEEDWVVYTDQVTGVQCAIVTGANADFIVLFEDGVMAKVSGTDVILEDLVVDPDNNVFYLDEPAGFIDFAEDGDDLPTLFWLTLGGTVVEIDTLTGGPFDSGLFPDEIIDTFCEDACELIDFSTLCGDDDPGPGNGGGGVPIPIFCGAGAPGAIGLSMLGLPLLGLARRRG